MNIFRFFSIAGLLLALSSTCALAETEQERKLGLLLDYLAADLIIREGVGLDKLKLGDAMSKAVLVFGQPKAGRDLTTDELIFSYSLDTNTELRITGRQRIRILSFKGNSFSPFSTARSAGFGMPGYQIRSIYGTPIYTNQKKTLNYPTKGIRFFLDNGSVNIIEVMLPTG